MRKLSIFLTICLFTACSGGGNPTDKTDNLYKQALIEAQHADQTENELFLGFKFGMSEKEIRAHLEKLRKDGKVYVNDDSQFQYDFIHSSGLTLYFNFIPEYYEGILYEMAYPIRNSFGPSSGDYVFVAGAFLDSERMSGFSRFITKDILGEPIYTYTKGNLIITFENSGGAEMKYTNAPIAKIVKAGEESEKREKAKESYSDF